MSEQFLLALRFTQISYIPTGNGGDCRWLRRKFLQRHHNSIFPFILSIQNSYFPTPHPKRFDSLVYDTSFINQFPMTPFIAFLQGLNIDLTPFLALFSALSKSFLTTSAILVLHITPCECHNLSEVKKFYKGQM